MSGRKAPVWTYPGRLEEVRLVGRRKRFFADVEWPDGRALTVHCANPGRMTSCGRPGARARISDSGNAKRTLRWSLEQVAEHDAWVLVNTARTNAVVEALVATGRLPAVPVDAPRRREAADGAGHRFDLLVEPPGAPRLWIEVKNVTWRVGDEARFPDAVTARGRRHLEGLAARVEAGERALLVFYVGRADVRRVRPAHDVDAAYATALVEAVARGVEVLALAGDITAEGLDARGTLPVDLGAPPPIQDGQAPCVP
ncbi:MAG: DNA/RNA nuclease SfsA [Planctomycetota bacterium]